MHIQPEIWGSISLIIGVVSYIPYFEGIFSGKTKPHSFSWFIWGLLTATAFFAQNTEGAGAGAWATGFSALICFFVFVWASLRGQAQITRSDWIAFIAALSAIPVWWTTKNPFYCVIWVCCIDALGFYPTFRKSWSRPQEENILTYALSGIKFSFALLALEQFNWTTALFPASLVLTNVLFVAMTLWRRKTLNNVPHSREQRGD